MNLSRRTKLGILIAALAVALAFSASEVVRYSRNVLRHHPEWINAKLLLENMPMGAAESLSTRNFLYRNRLNLHEWHGYNEFLLTKVFKLGAMQFDVCLAKDGYLTVLFNKDAKSFSALRLSRNSRYPSVYVVADASGRFLERTLVSNVVLTDSWHSIKITLQSDDLQLAIDGVPIDHWKVSPRDNQVVGFRSGASAASVDNVAITDAQGNWIIRDNFRNDVHFSLLFGSALLILGALIGGWFFVARWRKRDLRKAGLWILLMECVAISIVAIYFAFDFLYWSGQYPYKTFIPLAYHAEASLENARVEEIRASLFENFKYFDESKLSDSPDLARLLKLLAIKKRPQYQHGALQIRSSSLPRGEFEEIENDRATIQQYKDSHPQASYCVMIFGTSQTWGEGASTRSDQLAFQIHDALSEKLQNEVDLTVVNAGTRGGVSTELVERFKDRLHLLDPDVVVANLSNNDSYNDPQIFRANLTSLAEFNKKREIQTLFVLEANSQETNDDRKSQLDRFHQIMSDVAEDYGIPCIDLDAFLAQKEVYDSGILWWDYVHLTSYGQQLAAEFVAQAIAEFDRHGRE